MLSFTTTAAAMTILLALLERTSDAEASAAIAMCETHADCPKCSKCGKLSYWRRLWDDGWGRCVYDEANDAACRWDLCNTGICTAVDTCEIKQRPEQNSIKCGPTQWCRNGYCADLNDINVSGNLSMRGLQGQRINWNGEDGGWYALISDTDGVQISVRLTAPLPQQRPNRQVITALAMKYPGEHSLIIETEYPYTTHTAGCLDAWYAPCLAENSLRITVDGESYPAIPIERASLPGDAFITAVNLPAECRPSGGDRLGATHFPQLTVNNPRNLRSKHGIGFEEWTSGWVASTAAPSQCAAFLAGAGIAGMLDHKSSDAVFRIETPALTVRLNHGIGYEDREEMKDGRVLPGLELWQMDMHLEWYDLHAETVTGILGETMRPRVDDAGVPIMSGDRAVRGEVEDYRLAGPLDFVL